VSEATDAAQQRDLQLTTHISSIQDADQAAAITEFQQASYQQQAALQSRGLVPRRSLFDYLG
jgi:flagellin-like hook-associated protein FlgL